MARRVLNFADYSAHLLTRLRRQVELTGDEALAALYAELRGYPTVSLDPVAGEWEAAGAEVALPVRLASSHGELAFFSTIATFGTAIDLTLADLAIEAFFPADARTATILRTP